MLHFYKELKAWQRSVELVVAVYGLKEKFSKGEIYGLASQNDVTKFESQEAHLLY